MLLWIKAFHFIAIVLWFSGLFYLPRLFVYHAMTTDSEMKKRFSQMEKNLYYWVMSLGALFTLFFGTWLVTLNAGNALYGHWLLPKLGLVFLLLGYHLYLGFLMERFAEDRNQHSGVFYRWLNEVPTLFLVGIILLVVVK